jgi:hypothetical protein
MKIAKQTAEELVAKLLGDKTNAGFEVKNGIVIGCIWMEGQWVEVPLPYEELVLTKAVELGLLEKRIVTVGNGSERELYALK